MSVYDIVLKNILEELEKGTVPWQKPWITFDKTNIANIITNENNEIEKVRHAYKGINRLLLGDDEEDIYITFNEASKRGAKISKGAKSHIVVFSSPVENTDDEDVYNPNIYFALKYYRVFRLKDTEGIDRPIFKNKHDQKKINIEDFIKSLEIKVNTNDNKASYSPIEDIVCIPKFETFNSPDDYYATLFHELVHATGHTLRCKRELSSAFGGKKYSKEELVAEIGSAYLCSYFGINQIPKSASYLSAWLKELKDDKTLLFKASNLAENAVTWLLKGNVKSDTNA